MLLITLSFKVVAIAGAALLAGGIGLGRVKNAKKLAATKSVVTDVDNVVKAGVADVKAEVKKI